MTRAGSGPTHGRRARSCPAVDRRSRSSAAASTSADWNSTGRPSPASTMPRPGVSGRSSAAAALPTTATLSARCITRRETRIGQFAETCSRTTPLGRCEASTRCTPSERPLDAMSATTAPRSGKRSIIAWYSSTTSTSRGSTTCGPSPAMSRTPSFDSTDSRCRSSARRLSTARSASASSRSVTMPVTWGRSRIGSNAAPPLKSTSRNATRSGGWLPASAASQASRNSLFPLPVVPATIACGPCATRSSSSRRPATTPTATRRVDRDPAGVWGCSSSPNGRRSGRPDSPPTPSRTAADRTRSAQLAASASPSSSGTMTAVPDPSPRRSTSARRSPSTTTWVESPGGSSSAVPATAITAVAAASTAGPRGSDASTTRTTSRPPRCGRAAAHDHTGRSGTAIPTSPGRQR